MNSTTDQDHSTADITEKYSVTGMTCEHCVASVTEELSELDAVTGVDVELHPGDTSVVTVRSSTVLDIGNVQAAINEAGYTLVTP